MKGSVLILVMFIMAAISMLIITSFTIAEAHYNITKNNNSYQEVYYLAESGMEFAHNELYNLILNVHNDCLNEFHWDPFHNPMQSMQESVRMFIENNLGPKINKTLQEKGYNLNFPVPVMPNLPSEAKLDIRIRFTDIYQNPSRLLISSRAELGKIRRRIDSVVYINKVSKIYDSFLFDKVLLIGKDIVVQNGGYLEANGKIHAQGELNILNNSTISLSKFSSFNQNITVSNNCSVTFNDDIIAYGLSVKGEYPSLIKCIKDLYLYSILSVNDSDNTIQIKGKLFICPEDISVPAGVVAANGGIVELEDEIYVNGTLQYESNEQYLFGMKHLPLQYGKYHSSESIGEEIIASIFLRIYQATMQIKFLHRIF